MSRCASSGGGGKSSGSPGRITGDIGCASWWTGTSASGLKARLNFGLPIVLGLVAQRGALVVGGGGGGRVAAPAARLDGGVAVLAVLLRGRRRRRADLLDLESKAKILGHVNFSVIPKFSL
ncbi:hypothetical protein NQ318_019685 [Aromia moschata]|uniref:Uncharacterized protein n=1 Tax=Aromia moschata TaxID=1265417 RepID=A0AAV8Z6R1_9CUCU|nr:hypothetical protein NQ318_019685 [Aromia moschata]